MTVLIERLKDDPRVEIAAMIGFEFKIDPVVVLKADYFDFALRSAALEVVQTERKKAQDKQSKVK